MKHKHEMTIWERFYLVEITKGVGLTFGKLIKNLTLHILHVFGLVREKQASVTIQYPEERRSYPSRYRGRHRLTLKADGTVRCTSCFLCATACPAKCIYIEPEEHPNSRIEKYPGRFEIDTLLCIYCGYCVEACPVDAIRMDTGLHPEVYGADPRSFIEDKEMLMERSRELLRKTKEECFVEHQLKIQNLEKTPFE